MGSTFRSTDTLAARTGPPDADGNVTMLPAKRLSLFRITLAHLVAFLLGTLLIFFLTLGLPDAAYRVAGPLANETALAQLREEFALEGPAITRLGSAWHRLLAGELRSMYTRDPVLSVLKDKAPASVALVASATLSTVLLSAGVVWLLGRSNRIRRVTNALVGVSATVPVFITATFLLLLSSRLGIPLGLSAAASLAVFPAILLSTNLFERWREVRRTPHNVLAWHYGLSNRQLTWRMVRDSSGAGAILINAVIFFLATGIVIVEPLFGIPGVGRWLLISALKLDMPVLFVVGVALSGAIAVVSWHREVLLRILAPSPPLESDSP